MFTSFVSSRSSFLLLSRLSSDQFIYFALYGWLSSIAMKNRQPALKVLRDCVTENCWWHLYLCWRNLLLLLYFCSKWAGHQPCCNCSELSICLVVEIQIGHHRSHLFPLIIESNITCQLAALAQFLGEPHQPLTSSWLNLSAFPEHDFLFVALFAKAIFPCSHIRYWQTFNEN